MEVLFYSTEQVQVLHFMGTMVCSQKPPIVQAQVFLALETTSLQFLYQLEVAGLLMVIMVFTQKARMHPWE